MCVIIEAPTWAEPAGAGGLQRQAKETTGSCMYHLSTLSLLLSVFLPSHSLSHTHTLTHFEWSEKYYVSLYFPLFSSALASTYQPIPHHWCCSNILITLFLKNTNVSELADPSPTSLDMYSCNSINQRVLNVCSHILSQFFFFLFSSMSSQNCFNATLRDWHFWTMFCL